MGLNRLLKILKNNTEINQFLDDVKHRINKHLILVCAPKSGSTWLSKILKNLLGWPEIKLLPYLSQEQELDLFELLSKNVTGNVLTPYRIWIQ